MRIKYRLMRQSATDCLRIVQGLRDRSGHGIFCSLDLFLHLQPFGLQLIMFAA